MLELVSAFNRKFEDVGLHQGGYISSAQACAIAVTLSQSVQVQRQSFLVTSIDQQKLYGMCSVTRPNLENFINCSCVYGRVKCPDVHREGGNA